MSSPAPEKEKNLEPNLDEYGNKSDVKTPTVRSAEATGDDGTLPGKNEVSSDGSSERGSSSHQCSHKMTAVSVSGKDLIDSDGGNEDDSDHDEPKSDVSSSDNDWADTDDDDTDDEYTHHEPRSDDEGVFHFEVS